MSAPAPKCRACRRYGSGNYPHSCDIKHQLKAEPAGPGHDARHPFERRSAAKTEARGRVTRLRHSAAMPPAWSAGLGFVPSELLAVAAYIEAHIQSLNPKGNPASPTEKRSSRRRNTGVFLLYLRRFKLAAIKSVTILNKRWRVRAKDLLKFDPKKVLRQFHQHLNRSGVASIPGVLICQLDCEFDPVSQVFVFHIHCIGTETKVRALHRLKDKPSWGYVKTPTGSAPIVVKPIVDPVRKTAYMEKLFIQSKGVRTGNGKLERDKKGRRLPEPFHSQWLLWLFRQKNSDFRMLQRCRMLPCGHVGAA